MGSRLEKNSTAVRKRIESHTFEDEDGDEYEGSKFGGFPEYFRRKKIKLQNKDAQLRSLSTQNPPIFKGIVAQVNGYTQPSLNDLHHLIVSYGGGFMQYLDGKTTVTHIIAANLTPKKAIEFRKYRIVKPAWIVDSVAAGKLLPWEGYRVIDEGVGQRLIGFDDGKIVSQANTKQKGYREQTNTSWYTSQVKDVAEDIDDEDGAHFPSTQILVSNGTSAYLEDRPQHKDCGADDAVKADANEEPTPSYSGSFEVTSSLKAVLEETGAGLSNTTTSKHQPHSMTDEMLRVHDRSRSVTVASSDENNDGGPMADAVQVGSASSAAVLAPPSPTMPGFTAEHPSPAKQARQMTAEEHNEILLADPHIRKSSTANPEFLKQYYSESRLHHLSMWKADLKARLQQMAADTPSSQRPVKRKPGSRRYVMHVDFDSFFCAISLKSAPEYVDKPAVVAHGSGTGSEIASCNYPARKFGVKNGMWMKNANKLCPDLKVLPYDFPAYEEASKQFYEAILQIGGVVQSVSVDEALVDITSLVLPVDGTDGHGIREGSIWREQERADQLAQDLRANIKEKTGCAVSVGIGGNILLAKVALRRAKPAGQHQIKPDEVLDFIGELQIQDLPGVAYSIGGKLEEIGVSYVKDVRSLTKERLVTVLGPKTGEKIWDYSRGLDRTEVGEQVVRKSVSAEVNWGIRFTNQPEAEEFVQNLCGELHRRLLDQGVKGKQMTFKVMRRAADAPLDPPKQLGHGKCDTFNKSVMLGVATNSAEVLGREAVSILRGYGFSPGELRGLGVQMTKLELIRPSAQGLPDGSQRRITFGTATPISIGPPKTTRVMAQDPIDDPDSPVKTKKSAALSMLMPGKVNEAFDTSAKPLNLTGTQFVVPTQIDLAVLSELPIDIRTRLLAQRKTTSKAPSRAQSPLMTTSRSNSPALDLVTNSTPPNIDPQVFAALPEDVKAEVLASHQSKNLPRAQSLLPQSPRKVRPLLLTKKPTTPTKKRGLMSAFRKTAESSSALMQSNFVSGKQGKRAGGNASETEQADADLDPEFLAALPEDMRAEVLAEHRRARLAKKSGLVASAHPPGRRKPAQVEDFGQRRLRLPPRPSKPSFTTNEITTLPELRTTLQRWYEEFRDDGPHSEDVGAMERYLRRVVLEEKDLSKVGGVVNWLTWLIYDAIEGSHQSSSRGSNAWSQALSGIKDKIQEAVMERGIGPLKF